jgi:hypothetical protein
VITEVQQYLAELHRATATPTAPPR